MSTGLKTTLKIIASLVLIFVLLIVGVTLYITFRKDRFLNMVNAQLNKSVDGTILIGDMHPQFFKRFPNISLELENVLIRDKRFAQHQHTLLNAKNFDISLNTTDLLTGVININHIDISNAAIDLYTDSTGYSNISLFKKGPKKTAGAPSNTSSSTELEKFSLTNVGFKIDNQQAKKLFDFVVNNLDGRMEYPDSGWNAVAHLDVMAKSMAFTTRHGSFLKDKEVEGDLVAGFNEKTGKINIQASALDINDDPFRINAVFSTSVPGTDFSFHIAANQLLWRRASALLSPNISTKLNQFDIAKPIDVTAIISGNFAGDGPFLFITAAVRNSAITTPNGNLDSCSFDGVFTNNYLNGKGLTDENSVIRFTHFQCNYYHIPVKIDTGSIINISYPVIAGNIYTAFPVARLNYLLSDKKTQFGNGTVAVNLSYKADVVNYRVNKPRVIGSIKLKDIEINNLSAGLSLKNTFLTLNFTANDLLLSNFRIQTGRSTVLLDGRVNNFLNLYYNSPQKILLTLNVRSPQMYLAEFVGFLNAGSSAPAKTGNNNDVINQVTKVLHKGNAQMHLAIDNLHYNKFLATDVHADLFTAPGALLIQNVGLKTSGGGLRLTGKIQKEGASNLATLNTVISDVNVHDFFSGFNNFGLKDFTYENLDGLLSAKTAITAGLDNNAALISKSINGNIDVSIRNGTLINFKPLMGVGKFAFPFRDLKKIAIPKLDAHFAIHGDMIEISPLQISSSILNMDIAGTYGLTHGTDITMDIPLRNPKGDSTITDKEELKKKRFKGIVLHLLAKADQNGKIKIGFNNNKERTAGLKEK